MKKIKNLILAIIMILTLTGCSMKAEYNMEIREDKSMDFSIIMAMDNQLIEGMLSMENMEGTDESAEPKVYTDEEKWLFLESMFEGDSEDETEEGEKNPEDYGFTKEKYEVDEFKGFKFVKKINNIDDISGDTANFKLENFEEISDKVVFVKSGNKYKASFVLENENEESAAGADVMFDIQFAVTLPQEAISHNADKVSEDGKTLTWNLLDEKSQQIDFEFSLTKNNTMLIIGIAVFAIGLLAVILVIIKSAKSKKKKEDSMVPPTEPTTTAPVVTDQVAAVPVEPTATEQTPPETM